MKDNSSTRLPANMISRNLKKEALYGINNLAIYAYKSGDSSLDVVGQVFAGNKIQKDFCLIMTIYDHDGDIIESKESSSYGSGLVTSMIKPMSYFDGFPFKFYFFGIKWKEVSKIEIVPADTY